MINAPFETPVGAITAIIGVPFFLYLARKEGRER
jgi:iron complex transport system permease protein